MPKQSVAVELFYGGTWNNVVTSDEVLADTPITITRGNSDESPAPRPTNIQLRLNNWSDKFRTSNPMSPLYGKAGVNTPLRVSVGGVVRGYAEASSWSADQTTDFRATPRRGNAWVDVQAGGVLQRIGQWSRSVRSPLRVFDDNLHNVIGRWRMEDPAGATVASSDVAGTQNVLLRGHSFGSQNSPPGGGTAVDAGTNPVAQFVFKNDDPMSTVGWQISKVIYIDKLTGGGIFDPILACNVFKDEGARIFQLDGDTGNIHLLALGAGGTPLIDATFSSGGYSFLGKWLMIQLQASYSGGTTTLGASWRAIGDSSFLGVSSTYTGIPSQPYYSVAAVLPGSSYGHLVAVRGFTDDLTSDDRFKAFSGYPGERASYRFSRLCNENNISHFVSVSFDKSQRMGPQGVDTLAGQFQEIQATDDGIIYDERGGANVFFLSLYDRFNQTPALTLDAHANPTGMPSLPAETNDDLPIHNVVTAKQRGGGDFTATDDTSSMGTQDPPNGRGEYKQDVNVNTYVPAVALEQQAHWWLNRGTVDLPRYPQVTVDLASLGPAKIAEVEAVDIGNVIEIVNYRENTIRLYVVGYTETIGTHSRKITFNCAPDRQFNIGVLGTARLGARFTTLSTAVNSTNTTLVFQTTNESELWRPGASGVHVMIGGEEITLGTIGTRTGTGPWTWTITGCTRSVNGIVKSHSVGDQVTVKDAIRLGMGDPA